MCVLGSTTHEPNPDALDWMSDTPMPSRSVVHRYVVSPSVPLTASADARSVSTLDARAADRVEQRAARRAFVQHVRTVVPGDLGGLDQQVGPPLVVGVGGERQRVGHERAAEREVALRIRRHGPQIHTERGGPERRHPLGAADREVGVGEPPLAEAAQPFAELATVERVASALGDGSQRAGDARSHDAQPRATSL